jgi:hypothetical protein
VGSLKSLFEFQKPYKESETFLMSDFKAFVPQNTKSLKTGSIYWIINGDNGYEEDIYGNVWKEPKHLSKVKSILSLIHRNVSLQTRYDPRGSAAIIRGLSDNYIDIIFRMHIEFQLSPTNDKFWLSPAFLSGRIVLYNNSIDNKYEISYFDLSIPTYNQLNVDMEWTNGPNLDQSGEVDIGFTPIMSISTSLNNKFQFNDNYLKTSITYIEAQKRLEQLFYPFTQIDYLRNLWQVINLSKEQNKLIHVIVLWGSLTDQSC